MHWSLRQHKHSRHYSDPNHIHVGVSQVPQGGVTPFALVQDSAADVVCILDENIRGASELALHPLTNTQTVAISPAGLEAFLSSVGRPVTYVDLAAEPAINADNPPDLKHLLDSARPYADSASASAQPAQIVIHWHAGVLVLAVSPLLLLPLLRWALWVTSAFTSLMVPPSNTQFLSGNVLIEWLHVSPRQRMASWELMPLQ
eukprot:scaffold242176_cov53-Prasinocladus_malaysianus.AAC.2